MHYTYIVSCADGTLYTGYTTNLANRVKAHNGEASRGDGAKYTKARRPVTLVYYEGYETKQEAMSREAKIKSFTKKEKQLLIGRLRQSGKA